MFASENRPIFKVGGCDVPQLQLFAVPNVQLEHLIEIAIEQAAFMIHA